MKLGKKSLFNYTQKMQSIYWDKIFKKSKFSLYPSEDIIRFISRYTNKNNSNSIKVLEIGCGPGSNLWFLSREGFSVSGIDISTVAISKAREKLNDEIGKEKNFSDLRVGTFTELPWEKNSFDIVIENEALYANRLIDIKKAIDEIHRVLKNEGLFFGKLFGYKTSGYKNANILELNTFSNIKEGPLGGNKIAFIFNNKLIKRLFKSFIILSIDEIIRTNNNGNSTIHEYLVVAKKV